MIDSERFDPSNNRLCRDVRNGLSDNFKEVLEQTMIARTAGPSNRWRRTIDRQ
ncbi:MAG: hypothetical protein KFF68_04240 [Desulfosarcina sp.]|nr:hypothetical protein [Desulfosarcina sp.]